jgi:large subunit ribosomal protein L25
MEKVELQAEERKEVGKKAQKVRQRGLIPAVIYGRKFSATPVSLEEKNFEKTVLQSEAGSNLLFTLKLGGQPVPVITREIQRNPITNKIIHLDLMHVVMDEMIKAKVPVELMGEPIGVKEDGGVLVHGLRQVEIKCLPGDIPDKFKVDVAELHINQSIHLSDLKVSDKIEIIANLSEMIATVSPPTKEEVAAPPAAEAAAAEAVPSAVATEEVKEKAAPGAAPAKEKPTAEEKK